MVTPISTAATDDCDPVYGGCRCGLPYYSIYYQKVTQSRWIFCDGHRITGSLAAQSHSFWTVTNCDPGRSSKYGAYWSDHPLWIGKTGCNSPSYSGAPVAEQGIESSCKACPLCDTAPLQTSVTEHVLSNHFGGTGLRARNELLLRRLVDLYITF